MRPEAEDDEMFQHLSEHEQWARERAAIQRRIDARRGGLRGDHDLESSDIDRNVLVVIVAVTVAVVVACAIILHR